MSTSMTSPQRRRAFTTLFMVEMWERFGYYGMQALILYYMIQRLGFPDTRANLVTSAAAALVYATPAIGGLIGDRWLGTQRCIRIGAVILTAGYALLALPVQSESFLMIGLSVVIVGNGFFKANAGNLLSRIYQHNTAALDSASTLYYMAVNIGSTLSMLLTPWVNDAVNARYGSGLGWRAAFACCALGLLVGLANLLATRHTLHHVRSALDQQPVSFTRWVMLLAMSVALVAFSTLILSYTQLAALVVYALALIVLVTFVVLILREPQASRAGLLIAAILTLQTMLFFIFYQQMFTSLNLFALHNIDLNASLFGLSLWRWSPAQFQALDPIWIMLLSPLLAWGYTALERRHLGLPTSVKFLLGFLAITAGFAVFGSARTFAHDGLASSWVMVAGYGFFSLSELLISGLGIAMMSRYIPAHHRGFMIGIYFVATGLAQYAGGVIANLASVPADIDNAPLSLPIYSGFFMKMCLTGVGFCVLVAVTLPWLLALQRRHAFAHSSS
ncbi:peptide MFS transporter [Zymobacter sp. IVIA_12111.31 C1]|uniref:peptide MFS transporter n=1 Tax=Zymobacter sp. IVIA_12111.31 C1 TaxID=3394854 RepID=UPI0039C14612